MFQWVKKLPANAGDVRDESSIPGLERSSGEGNGNPLQYSCLENHIDRGAWQAAVHRVTKSRTWLKRLSTHTHTHTHTHTVSFISSTIPDSTLELNLMTISEFVMGLLCEDPQQASLSVGILQASILEWAAMLISELNAKKIVYF